MSGVQLIVPLRSLIIPVGPFGGVAIPVCRRLVNLQLTQFAQRFRKSRIERILVARRISVRFLLNPLIRRSSCKIFIQRQLRVIPICRTDLRTKIQRKRPPAFGKPVPEKNVVAEVKSPGTGRRVGVTAV